MKISHINVGEKLKKITFGDNKNIIGSNLKILRKEKKLSQGDLSAKLQTYNINIDQQMISRIENNSRIVTDYELACLALALNVDIRELLGDVFDDLDKK